MMPESPLLSVLLDIYTPTGVRWWPLAPGWWLLLAIAIFLLFLLIRKWYRSNSLRREALIELKRIRSEFEEHQMQNSLTMEINILLRRVALANSPRSAVAGLIGNDWLNFLDQRGGDGEFTKGPGSVLELAPYTLSANIDTDALLKLTERWIRRNV